MKRILTVLTTAVLALGASSVTSAEDLPGIVTGIDEISHYGNILLLLDISGSSIMAPGYDYGDIVTVEIDGQAVNMPICSNYSDVDSGKPVLRLFVDEGKEIDTADSGNADGRLIYCFMRRYSYEEAGKSENRPQGSVGIAFVRRVHPDGQCGG